MRFCVDRCRHNILPGLLDAAEDSEPCVAGSGLNLLGKRAAALQTAWADRVKSFGFLPSGLGRHEFKTARTDGADAAMGRCSATPSASQ